LAAAEKVLLVVSPDTVCVNVPIAVGELICYQEPVPSPFSSYTAKTLELFI